MTNKIETKIKELIKKAHQEAHECYSSGEVHTWIDWFEKEMNKEFISQGKNNKEGLKK
jgi:hypothetical protein